MHENALTPATTTLEHLHKDVLQLIFSAPELRASTVFRVNKYIYSVLNTESFWKLKVSRTFNDITFEGRVWGDNAEAIAFWQQKFLKLNRVYQSKQMILSAYKHQYQKKMAEAIFNNNVLLINELINEHKPADKHFILYPKSNKNHHKMVSLESLTSLAMALEKEKILKSFYEYIVEKKAPLYIKAGYASLFGRQDILMRFRGELKDKWDSILCLGSPLLSVACECGALNTARMLVEDKADVNKANQEGVSPLFIASEHGHAEVVRFLIENKANINGLDEKNITPLYMASQNNYSRVVQILLESKANANHVDNESTSALWIACYKGYASVARMLIDFKADVNKADAKGMSPLWVSCQKKNNETVSLLIKHNASVNQADRKGFTPLSIACQQDTPHIVSQLLEQNPLINQPTKNGRTPLFFAVEQGRLNLVKTLLKNNASTQVCCKVTNKRPIDIANDKKNNAIASLLTVWESIEGNSCSKKLIEQLNKYAHDNRKHLIIRFFKDPHTVQSCILKALNGLKKETSVADADSLERLIGLIKYHADKNSVNLNADDSFVAILNACEIVLGKSFDKINPIDPKPAQPPSNRNNNN